MELLAETILCAGSLFEGRTTHLIHIRVNDARVNHPAGGSNYVSNPRSNLIVSWRRFTRNLN